MTCLDKFLHVACNPQASTFYIIGTSNNRCNVPPGTHVLFTVCVCVCVCDSDADVKVPHHEVDVAFGLGVPLITNHLQTVEKKRKACTQAPSSFIIHWASGNGSSPAPLRS